MTGMFRVRWADAPMNVFEGEIVTDDFEEAMKCFRNACRHYPIVDFHVRERDSRAFGADEVIACAMAKRKETGDEVHTA